MKLLAESTCKAIYILAFLADGWQLPAIAFAVSCAAGAFRKAVQ